MRIRCAFQCFAAVAAWLPAVASFAQSTTPRFGTSDLTYVRVTGQEFFPPDGSLGYAGGNSGLGRYPMAGGELRAALHVPGGAIIDSLELDFCNTSAINSIQLVLNECGALAANCSTVALVGLDPVLATGCMALSETAIGFTVDNVAGSLGLTANFGTPGATDTLKITSAIVGYRLQVSPSPATATFGDVPTGHPFFQFVEALAASGITAGCGGGNFCPDSPLTRGQMAAFLSKALGLHWADH